MSYWHTLSNKDRQMALILFPALFIMLLYFGVIRSASKDIMENQALLNDANQSLVWMKEKQKEISTLKKNTPRTTHTSVMQAFNQYGKRNGIHQSIQSITPSSNSRVNIQMESVNYTSLIETLNTLSMNESILVENIRVSRIDNNGVVNATLVLAR
ncbi:MAG: type II secretion system protein M [Gammaproteobacteria bacterium]|nr:type II secretion system protein M [Gammaproteobacteria bacterium]